MPAGRMEANVPTVRVLIIDDDPEFQDRANGVLSGLGETRVASNAGCALQVIPTWTPDVILLDLMLEDLDGFAFLDLLIAMKPDDPPSVLCMIDGPGAGTRLLPVAGWPVGTLLRSSTQLQFRLAVLKAAATGRPVNEQDRVVADQASSTSSDDSVTISTPASRIS